jgi:hypothetical protein
MKRRRLDVRASVNTAEVFNPCIFPVQRATWDGCSTLPIHPQDPEFPMEALFRSIDVGYNLQLALGETIPPDVMKDMKPAGANTYKFKDGTYTRAESILVTVDAKQIVQSMEFGYPKEMEYAWQRANFINEIGEPTGGDGVPNAQQQSVWQDSQTRFVLWAKGQGEKSRMGSTLTNLAS